MSPSPRVMIIDDDEAVRESLQWLISSVGIEVETFPDAQAFLADVAMPQEGCIVIDVRMPGMSGLDLQKELHARKVKIPIIIVTGHGDVQMAVRAMREGAYDFIEKPFNDQQLLESVQHAVGASKKKAERQIGLAEAQKSLESLTPREREVLDLITVGKANKQVAFELGISEKTVEAHRAKVMEKMAVRTLAELVRKVLSVSDIGENP